MVLDSDGVEDLGMMGPSERQLQCSSKSRRVKGTQQADAAHGNQKDRVKKERNEHKTIVWRKKKIRVHRSR